MKNMPNSGNFKGPGIAAVGFVTGAASALMLLCCYLIEGFTEAPRAIYLAAVLIGYSGFAAGLITCAVGVVITWASIGLRAVNLAWLNPITARVLRWSPAIAFKVGACGALIAAVSLASGALQMAGVFGLASATFIYAGSLVALWKYLATQLLGDR